MTTYNSALYGVGLSGFIVIIITGFVFFIRYRQSFGKNVSKSYSSDLHLSPIAPTVTVQERKTRPRQQKTDVPPDYETVMRSSSKASEAIVLPSPTPDQMGTFTTHYVTAPSSNTPHPENNVLYISGPLSELH